MYSPHSSNPRRQMDAHIRCALENNVLALMTLINKFSIKNYRLIDFKRLYYGYMRTSRAGVSYIIDLLMDYKQFQLHKRTTIPVRRHAYAMQTFGQPYIRELDADNRYATVNVVLPLSGRVEAFTRFMANFVRVYNIDKRVTLAIVLFPDAADSEHEFQRTKEIINEQSAGGIPIRTAYLSKCEVVAALPLMCSVAAANISGDQ